jgi:integrative and conjugative element protein (TIGR02256 family)
MPRLWPLVWAPRDRALYVLLAPSVVQRLEAFLSTDSGKLESGGILLGFRRDPHLEVLDSTSPGAKDLRRPYQFVRRCESHQTRATDDWKTSGKTIDYLGEWHTHPEASPMPSGIDRSEMIRRSNEHRSEVLVELIVGTHSIWLGIARGGRYIPLIAMDERIRAVAT